MWEGVATAKEAVVVFGLGLVPTLVSSAGLRQEFRHGPTSLQMPTDKANFFGFGELNESGKIAASFVILIGIVLIIVLFCTCWSVVKTCRELRQRKRLKHSSYDEPCNALSLQPVPRANTAASRGRPMASSASVCLERPEPIQAVRAIRSHSCYGAVRWV